MFNRVLSGVGMKLQPGRRATTGARPLRRRPPDGRGAAARGPDRGRGQRHARDGRRVGGPADPARGGRRSPGTGQAGLARRTSSGWSGTRSTGSRWSTCWSARPSPGARPRDAAAASPPARAAAPGPRAPTPTCSAAATRAPRSTVLARPAGSRTARHGTAAARWSPSWTPASAPTRGWTWRPRPAADTTPIPTTTATASSRSITTSRRRSCSQGEQAAAAGDQPRQVIRHPWDTPVSADPLIGELDPALGHGTFIAGHRAPGRAATPGCWPSGSCTATTSSTRATCCPRSPCWPAGWRWPRPGDPAKMVDVVSLSLGYFSESPSDQALHAPRCGRRSGSLLDLGVVVVAAAGNYSDQPPVLPGRVRRSRPRPGSVPVISVGALNPNGSKAMFSDGGRWVTGLGLGRRRGQHLPDRHQRQPQPRAQAARAPGRPAAARPRRGPPTGRRSTRTTTPRRLRGLERHLVLGSAAGRAVRPGAAGGTADPALRPGTRALRRAGDGDRALAAADEPWAGRD